MSGGRRVLVVGVSTRALADAAAHAGWTPVSVDAFGDLDNAARPHALSLHRDVGVSYGAAAVVRAACDMRAPAVAYTSNLENHPAAVARLAAGRVLLGNPPDVLRHVRDPRRLAAALRRRGLPTPAVRGEPPAHASRRWLIKPRRSGGGHGIVPWRAGMRVPRGAVLQQRIPGTPGSIVFVAARGRAAAFGISRQLVGEHAFGARGFIYCGSIMAAPDDPALLDRAAALAAAVADAFGLVGLNGVDFVAHDRVPWPLEVNPRWTASMELAQRALGLPLFGWHARAVVDGTLPHLDVARLWRGAGAVGKAVLYARRTIVVADPQRWLRDPDVRDVPHSGERIPRGQPICTVFARARDAQRCHDALVRKARTLYEEIDRSCRRTA